MPVDPPSQLQDFVETSQDIIWQCDAQGRFSYLNPACETTFGYVAEEMLGRRFSDFQSPEVASRDEQEFACLMQGGTLKGHETVCIGSTGKDIHLIISAKSVRSETGQVIGARGTALDITERKQAVEALRKSEERFRKIVEQAPMAMAIVSSDGVIEFINRKAVKVFGYLPEDIHNMDRWWVQAYPDEDYRRQVIADWMGRVYAAISEARDIVGNEYKVTCKDGTLKTVFISGVPVTDKIFVLFDDITERKRAEEKLRKSEERYRRLVETTDTGYVIVDHSGVVVDANREYSRLAGYDSVSEILGRSVLEWTTPEDSEINAKAIAQCVATGSIRNFEVSYIDKTGRRTPVDVNATTLEAEGKQQILSLCRDITERKRAENLLSIQHTLAHELNAASSTEAWLELCLNAALVASEMDCGGIYLLNEADKSFRLVGHKGLSDAFVASASFIAPQSPYGQLVSAGRPIYSEYSPTGASSDAVRRFDMIRAMVVIPLNFEGRAIGCLNLGSHSRDDVPTFARTALETIGAQIGTGIARLKTEEALRQSNEKFSKIFRISPDSITISRISDGTVLEVNQSFTDTTGFTPEDIVGRSALPNGLSLWPNPEERNRFLTTLIEHGEAISMEVSLRVKDGSTRIALFSARMIDINGEECMLAVGRDITERKRMEEALFASERRYKMVSELATDYVYKLGVAEDGKVTMDFVSENFYSLTGRTRQDVLTVESWSSVIHPNDLGRVRELLQRLVSKPQSAELECRSYSQHRELRWVNVIATSEWDELQRRVTGIVGAVKDITARKLAEQRVAAEKERLAVTLRSIGDGVITTDINGHIDIMNKVAEELTGWHWSEAQGRPLEMVFNIVDELTRTPRENPVAKVLATGNIVELATPTLLVTQNGTELMIADSGAPIKDGDGNTIGGGVVFRDVTEKQKIMDTIQRTAKLDSLGVLAGGIAHDFNNLLTGIFGYIDLARSTSDNDETLEYLGTTIAAMNRARALTLQLLTFAKGGSPVQKVTPLLPFIQEAVQFALSGSNVACRFSFSDDLWPCNIDKNQISQVIDNIVINAQQAMPNGGALEVTAHNVSLGEKENPALAKGKYVKVSIKDFGIGIPKDIILRIFDPFYTTKTKGHGLGLATCYSIINRHAGCIEVESEPGKGSSFYLFLPAVTDSLVMKQSPVERQAGSGTIIVVDDDDVIRSTIQKMLKSLGYAAVCMKDGREAIDFYVSETQAGRFFSAIILDLTIPGGMGGIEAVAELRKMGTNIPVFVASGYADDSVMRSPVDFGFTASLCKPFTIAELSEMLSRHLT
jgi:PAS domain S-box-containing protein